MVWTVISRLCGFLRWSRFQITRLQGYAGLQGCNFAGMSTKRLLPQHTSSRSSSCKDLICHFSWDPVRPDSCSQYPNMSSCKG